MTQIDIIITCLIGNAILLIAFGNPMLIEPRHDKKPVFGVFDQVTNKPVCAATEAS